MFYAAIGCFALSAVSGLVLALHHLKGRPVAVPSALVHGALGASGLVLYLIAALKTGITALSGTSLALFVAAALGGFVLFAFHLKGRPLPKALLAVHALAAVSAFLMLLAVVFAGGGASAPAPY
jgi:hypothetical protein